METNITLPESSFATNSNVVTYQAAATPKRVQIRNRFSDVLLLTIPGETLTGVDLSKKDLIEANFSKQDLSRANLAGASLICSNLCHANLSNANLQGADFTQARLDGVNFDSATYDDNTVWPAGFCPEKCGAIKQNKPQITEPTESTKSTNSTQRTWWQFWS